MANSFSEDAFGFRQKAAINVNNVMFNASGLYYGRYGYYKVYPYFRPRESPIPRLVMGDKVRILDVSLKTGYTRPPDRLSEAELLMIMERNGIGTDATRALYPKLISERKYASKKRGRFIPTILGMKFIESLEKIDERLVTPETRKYVEELMNKVGEGRLSFDSALKESLSRYKELFKEILNNIDKVSETLSEGLVSEDDKK
jgi:DNA topoisomerase IA